MTDTPAPVPSNVPHVTIALCTFNGAAHLHAQLDSYLAQDHTNWSLWVSDDGSRDETRTILAAFARKHGAAHHVRIIDGPARGVAANFLSLLCHPDFPAGPVALSDQDDVWLPEKLARAVAMTDAGKGLCLYGAQSIHVDDQLTPIGGSATRGAVPSFANALVQNIISGHSAFLSEAVVALVRRAGVRDVPYQDWWLYVLVTGAGGRVIVDDQAVVLYRQHAGNLMGAHSGWRATMMRITQVFGTTYARWLDDNTTALSDAAQLLTSENRAVLAQFAPRPRRLRPLRQLGIHRQGRLGTMCLYLAAVLRRL